MTKTLRINLTLDEIEVLIRSMENSSSPSILNKKDKLVVKYLEHAVKLSSANLSPFSEITKAISLLTGKSQDQIILTSKLSNLGLTPIKMGQLRAHLNAYIKKQDGNSFITDTEMSIAITIADLNKLVESKIP